MSIWTANKREFTTRLRIVILTLKASPALAFQIPDMPLVKRFAFAIMPTMINGGECGEQVQGTITAEPKRERTVVVKYAYLNNSSRIAFSIYFKRSNKVRVSYYEGRQTHKDPKYNFRRLLMIKMTDVKASGTEDAEVQK